MKIDIYAHFMPQKVIDAFTNRVGNKEIIAGTRPDEPFNIKVMCDVEKRREIIQKYPGLAQVLVPTGQPIERFASPKDTAYLTQLYNDELAEIVHKYPQQFVAGVGLLSMNNIKAAVKEIDRAINQLGLKGMFLQTPIIDKPMDLPEFMPVYERMASYDLPIWIHPARHFSYPDYTSEKVSKYGLYHAFGWPYETTIAMCRLVCSGILTRYPNLKFITHHAGAMIPFLSGRTYMINPNFYQEYLSKEEVTQMKPVREQLKMFYNDTAIYGNTPGLICARDFFGSEHLLFGTDAPYGPGFGTDIPVGPGGVGEDLIWATTNAIKAMNIPEEEKTNIFEGNAKRILRLKI